ncbi:hypothetical protein M9Y10_004143 [Tritrichomonas musculus]|uniref:Clan CD, family C13, asparaginyl endopeptidase-like cysteine peptidase n=1 Tax=Tritrichomonas musculus TaxID=1915356 RepID=A0ABR2JR77_9EUKA
MFLLLSALVSCKRFALLYAGSNGFYNYRHQADIFTIYNQLLARGFTYYDMAVYAYNDIATDSANPFTGQVFHSIDHKVNVFPGDHAINCKGDKVTAHILYNALSTLPTSRNDYIFMYYDNHGGPGILGVPDGNGDDITADLLSEAFTNCSQKHAYKQFLFLIEACYAGSVAQEITAPNVAIITAANDHESSYAAVYDEEVGTYLSNEFSNNFISIIDESPELTVGELFTTLKTQTVESHVTFYGDESMKSELLSTFIGTPNRVMKHNKDKSKLQLVKPKQATEKTLEFLSKHEKVSIRARARLQQLRLKAQSEKLEAVLDLLVKYVDPQNYDKIMNDTQSKITPTYYEVLKVFNKRFGQINPDDYDRLMVIKALAATHTKAEIVQGIFAVL